MNYVIDLPEDLHPDTRALVASFAEAMGKKLLAAQKKHGFTNDWMNSDWQDKCGEDFLEHIAKGDPRDVANYCAFMWHHGWMTSIEAVVRPKARTRLGDLQKEFK